MSDTAVRLAQYKSAEARILKAQSLGHGDRSLTNASLSEVRAAIKDLEAQLAAESRGGQPAVMVSGFNRGLG